MNDLEEIKARWSVPPLAAAPALVAVTAKQDIDRLVAEVERLQAEEAVAWQKGYEQGYADHGQA
jgi:hypothetical protein